MAKRSKKYTDEFKRDAVRLMRNRGNAHCGANRR